MSPPLNCADAEQYLSDLLAGALDEPSQHILNEHLSNCATCVARAIVLFRQDRALAELGSCENFDSLKQRIHAKLLAASATVAGTNRSKIAPPKRARISRLRRAPRSAKSFAGMVAFAAALMMAAILYFTAQKNMPAEPMVLAYLTAFEGSPTITHEGRAIDARNNLNLVSGDKINVPAGASATIKYAEQDTRLIVSPSSVVRLSPSNKGNRVALESGSLDAEVAPQAPGNLFVISTPLARAEVIGTHFQLAAEISKTRLDVAHGRVRLVRDSDSAQVMVSASQYAIALPSGQMLTQESNPVLPQPQQIKRVITRTEQNDLRALATNSKPIVMETLQRFTAQTFKGAHGSMPYRQFTPEKSSPDVKYPVVIYLHGIGGTGKDNIKQLNDQPFGAGLWAMPANQARHPCFVIAPQTTGGWEGNAHVVALDLIEELLKTLPIDPQRVYVTGVSSGCNGAFWLLQTRPKQFAAGILLSGWMPDAKNSKLFSSVPIWLFHGNNDPTVKVGNSRQAYDSLAAAGADVRFYEYDGAGHDIFAPAYNTPDLIDWVFARWTVPK